MNLRGNRCRKFKILTQGLVCCRSERIPSRGILLWSSKSTAKMSFRRSQVLGKPFLNAAPKTVRVHQLQHVWERLMNFFLRSAVELVLCFPDGIERERQRTQTLSIEGQNSPKKLNVTSGSNLDSHLDLHVLFYLPPVTKQCEFLHFLQNFHNERRPVILSSVTFFRYTITSFVTAGSEYLKS